MAKHFKSIVQDSCSSGIFSKQLEYCRIIYKKGGIFVAGTDPVGGGVLPGFGMKRELEIFVEEIGIPVNETIKIASLNGAKVMKVEDELGSISVNKRADLVLINGDLEIDISKIGDIDFVTKDGIIYYPEPILKELEGKVFE